MLSDAGDSRATAICADACPAGRENINTAHNDENTAHIPRRNPCLAIFSNRFRSKCMVINIGSSLQCRNHGLIAASNWRNESPVNGLSAQSQRPLILFLANVAEIARKFTARAYIAGVSVSAISAIHLKLRFEIACSIPAAMMMNGKRPRLDGDAFSVKIITAGYFFYKMFFQPSNSA